LLSKIAVPPEQGNVAPTGPQVTAPELKAKLLRLLVDPVRKYRYFRPISILSVIGA